MAEDVCAQSRRAREEADRDVESPHLMHRIRVRDVLEVLHYDDMEAVGVWQAGHSPVGQQPVSGVFEAVEPKTHARAREELLWSRLAKVRFAGGRIVEEADMRTGPKGFAVAHWQDGSSTETEVTNMMLEAHQAQRQVRKKPAAPAVMKVPTTLMPTAGTLAPSQNAFGSSLFDSVEIIQNFCLFPFVLVFTGL